MTILVYSQFVAPLNRTVFQTLSINVPDTVEDAMHSKYGRKGFEMQQNITRSGSLESISESG